VYFRKNEILVSKSCQNKENKKVASRLAGQMNGKMIINVIILE
jgi:hypothetical protein